MKRTLPIANGVAFIIMVAINYLSNTGVFNGSTVAIISAKYTNLFTPAGYAFSIWILIYLALLVFVIFQGRSLGSHPVATVVVRQVGWWFVVSCLANSAWVLAWVYDLTGLSVLIMLVLVFSLLKIILRTEMELTDPPLKIIAAVWWPFCLYSGWITVALLANIAAWLTKIGWNGLPQAAWAMIMIVVADAIYLFMTWRRNMREFAFVGVWGLVAVAVADQHQSAAVASAAYAVAAMLFISSCIHGYKNREFSPWRRRS